MTECVMTYDCGTTSLKAAAVDSTGVVLAQATRTYGVRQPHPGWAEQDPGELWDALCAASREVTLSAGADVRVRGCVFVAPWKGIIALSAAGEVLSDSITWLDRRASVEGDELEDQYGEPLGTGHEYWAKLVWLKRHCPDLWEKADHIVGLNTYFKWRATGVLATEPSDDFIRSANPVTQGRYQRILQLSGLDEDVAKFPPSTASTDVVGAVTPGAAEQLGLPVGVPVFGGFGDLAAIATGAGRAADGDAHIYLGTSSWLVCVTEDDPRLQSAFHYSIDDAVTCVAVAGLQAAGLALDWINQQVYRAERAELGEEFWPFLQREVRSAGAGSLGLIGTHWLVGESDPIGWDARGTFLNLSARHDRKHLVRAVMESVCYTHRMGLERLRGVRDDRAQRIRVVGGGAMSEVWVQMLADVLGEPVEVPAAPRYIGAMGAHYCALVGLGEAADYSDAAAASGPGEARIFEPDATTRAVYDKAFGAYVSLADAVRPLLKRLNSHE